MKITLSSGILMPLSFALAVGGCALSADGTADQAGAEVSSAAGALSSNIRLLDENGQPIRYESCTREDQYTIDYDVRAFVASNGGAEPLGCQLGPGWSVSCWGGGYMCAAWIDEDGPGAQCWKCELSDCR